MQNLVHKTFVGFSHIRTSVYLTETSPENMASQSASRNSGDPAFQRNAAEKFSAFQTNAQQSSDILSQLAADKGLANYDKNDQLETILKDLVNANKDALSAVYVMINNDPNLGPILGPSVYL